MDNNHDNKKTNAEYNAEFADFNNQLRLILIGKLCPNYLEMRDLERKEGYVSSNVWNDIDFLVEEAVDILGWKDIC